MPKRYEGSIPERFHLCGSIGGNAVQQLRVEAIRGSLEIEEETDARGRVVAFDVVMPSGERIRVLPSGAAPGNAGIPVLVIPKAGFLSDERGWDLATTRSVRWLSPFGPLRIEYGVPLNISDGERKSSILFSFGAPL